MADNNNDPVSDTPRPDRAMQRLARLVGVWSMKGRPAGSHEESITGTTTFKWLHAESGDDSAGFFLQQDMEMDYAGTRIRSHELIGFNPSTQAFSSYVYSNMAPEPWPYDWDIDGDRLTISIKHDPMDAAFEGRFAPDGNSFSGSWRPNAGADETINAPYDITCTRVG